MAVLLAARFGPPSPLIDARPPREATKSIPRPRGDDGLTDRQRAVLEFIRSVYRDRGVPPPLREIMRHFGILSPNGVMYHVKVLRNKGFLMPGGKTGRSGRSLMGLVPTAPPGHCRCCGQSFPPPGGGGGS